MNNNMETNKETRMISSDEIFYAVLKDGTVVSNFREAVESMNTHSTLSGRYWRPIWTFLTRRRLSLPF